MSWTLGGVSIRSAHKKVINPSVATSTKRALSGRFTRDAIGEKKMILSCAWTPMEEQDYNTIVAAYLDQVENGTSKALVISETGFSFSGNVIIQISAFEFGIPNQYEVRDMEVEFIEI